MAFPQCAGRIHILADCLDEGVAAESWLSGDLLARSVVISLSVVDASVVAMQYDAIWFCTSVLNFPDLGSDVNTR